MNKKLNIKFEKGIRLLVKYFPASNDSSRKPILFHDISDESGHSDEETREKASKLNPMAYVVKPFDFPKLDALIRSTFQE